MVALCRPAVRPSVAAVPLACLALVACGAADGSSGDSSSGDTSSGDSETLTISQYLESGDLVDIDPLGDHVPLPASLVYDTLVSRTADGELVGRLAESWTATDETTWRVVLREGVTFHDGTPFDAQDVAATLEHVLDPENSSGYLRFVRSLDRVDVVDPMTVDLVSGVPNKILPDYLVQVPMLSDEQLRSPDDDHGTRLVGTGPYAMDEWLQGESVRVVRDDGYWDEPPGYASVLLKAVPEPSTRLADLESGTAQMIGDVLPDQVDRLRDAGAEIETEPAIETAYLAFVQRGAFTAPQVRSALYHALDREQITRTVRGDLAEVATSVVPQDFTGYSEVFPTSDHDPEEARRLLEEAGVTTPVEADLDTFSVMAPVAELVREQAEAVGFDLTVNIVSRSALFDSDRVQSGDRPRLVMSTSLDNRMFDAYRPLETFFGEEAFVADYGYTPDPANQQRLDAYLGAEDDEARTRLSREVQETVAGDPQAIWLYFPSQVYATAEGTCYEATGTGQLRIAQLDPC